MVEINLDLKLTEEESERALETFYLRGFRWSRKIGQGDGCRIERHCIIGHYNLQHQVSDSSLKEYFEDSKLKLKAGCEQQLMMVKALTLMAILFNSNCHYSNDSDYLNKYFRPDSSRDIFSHAKV